MLDIEPPVFTFLGRRGDLFGFKASYKISASAGFSQEQQVNRWLLNEVEGRVTVSRNPMRTEMIELWFDSLADASRFSVAFPTSGLSTEMILEAVGDGAEAI